MNPPIRLLLATCVCDVVNAKPSALKRLDGSTISFAEAELFAREVLRENRVTGAQIAVIDRAGVVWTRALGIGAWECHGDGTQNYMIRRTRGKACMILLTNSDNGDGPSGRCWRRSSATPLHLGNGKDMYSQSRIATRYAETMIKRRKMMILAAGAASAAMAQTPGGTARAKPIFKQPLPDLQLAGWAANAVEVTYGPGESSNPHQHAGFVLGYVLEGEVRFQLRGEAERIVRAGEMFYEPPGSVHQVSGNASKTRPARLLAIIMAPADATLTKPA